MSGFGLAVLKCEGSSVQIDADSTGSEIPDELKTKWIELSFTQKQIKSAIEQLDSISCDHTLSDALLDFHSALRSALSGDGA